MLVHHERDYLDCARAVLRLNESARAAFKGDPAALASFMWLFAQMHLSDKPTYGGTYGFYITIYTDPSDPSRLRPLATVAPWLVKD